MKPKEIDGAVGVGVSPQRDRIAGLLVSRPEQGRGHKQNQNGDDAAPLVARQRRLLDVCGFRLRQGVHRQQRHGIEINSEPDQHADAGGGKAVMPAGFLAQRAANQRRQERAEIDADIEDRIGAVAAMVARRIEPSDLGGNIRLEGAVAENERQQRKQQQLLDRHQKMADRHQHRADHHGAALTEHAVGEQPAEDRRQIDQSCVKAVDLRRQWLHVERPEHRLQAVLEADKADHLAGMTRQQHIFRHVENEQRAHPVIGKALPHLGGEQEGKALRMAEELVAGGHAVRLGGVMGRSGNLSQDRSLPFSFAAIVSIRRSGPTIARAPTLTRLTRRSRRT